jgi:two-component system chemotaxis response regulator CheB
MPINAMRAVEPDFIGTLDQLADWLTMTVRLALLEEPSVDTSPVPLWQREIAEQAEHDGLTCPECSGPITVSTDGELLRFECPVGHKWSESSFQTSHHRYVEQALWAGVRVLEERANLYRRLADRSATAQRIGATSNFRLRALEAESQANVLRGVIASAATHEPPVVELRPAAGDSR